MSENALNFFIAALLLIAAFAANKAGIDRHDKATGADTETCYVFARCER